MKINALKLILIKDMKNASEATYLGDVISENGTIDATILQRTQKATGIINQISSMLSSICLGSFHFDIAIVLRNKIHQCHNGQF